MANLTTCLQKVGAKLDPADKAAVMARSRELRTLAKERGEPMSATDAARQAAKDVISEIRAELKAAEPAQPAQRKSAHPKTVMGSELLAIVSARLGGLDPSLISEFSVNVPTGKFYKNGVERTEWRNPMIPGVGKLFRRGGRQDRQEIAQVLEDADYLEPGAVANDYKEAGERAKELIKAALDRNIPKTLSEQQAEMEASQEAERKAYYDALDEESAAEADAERAAIMAEAGMGRVEMAAVDDADLFNMAGGTTDTATQMRAMGFTEQEIADELAREAQVAAAAAQASAGQDAQAGPEAAPEAGPAGTAAAQPGSEPAEGLTLEAQTPESLESDSTRKKAAADADAKEQKRLERKAKADAEAPEFQLTGSDRAADVGAAAGQGDIFDQPSEPAPPARFASNKVFTQSDVDAARALLKKKLGQLNSGIDPELMQAGITIAGAYIESGVRKFADFARVMVDDLGDRVKPYLHSWYMALRADPRSAAFRDEMDRASAVEDLDVDAVLAAPKAEPAKQAATGKIDDFFKTVEQKADDAGNVALLSQRPGSAYDQAFQRAVLGEATADDRRTIQSRPGYGNRAETALAGNVDAARALRGELEAAFGTNGGPFLDSRRGAIAVQSVWLRSASDADLARLTEAADRFNAPIIARGLESQDSPAFVKRMRAAGFETYTGMLEAGDRNVRDVAIAMVRPGGGITATTPLFSRGLGRGTPLSTLKPHIDAITAKMPGLRNAVTVVGTVTDLPQGIVDSLRSMNALGTVRGLRMPDGRVFLVADKLDSQLEAEFVLFHEVFGHEGLRAILNAEEYARAMTLVRLSNKAVAAEADRWMNSYGADQIEARIQNGMTPEAARREVRLLAVEEALADRAGKNDAPSVWKNVMAIVQKALRRMGMNDLANWLENRTEAETYALLMQARKAITNPKKVHAFTPATSPLFQRAYHGTPARNIERFSTDFIGTGEGNQAYGYGLYFASRRDVAEYYRRALSGESDRVFTKDGKTLEGDADLAEAYYKPGRIVRGYSGADKVLQFKRNDNGGWGVQVVGVKANGEAMQFERPRWHSTLPDGSTLRSVLEEDGWNPSHAGQIYEVEIPGDDELLLWDKPMSEQPAKVRDALAPFIERYTDNQRKIMSAFSPAEIEREIKAGLKTISGQGIYEQAGYMEGGGDRSASEYLSSLGVKGIKYLDGVSRNKPLRDVKREFLAELPEDAGFDEVMDLIGSGTFSQKNEAVLRALADNDWLGFDYPAQAISTALSSQLSNFDPSPELVQAVAATQDDSTYNYVIFSGDDVAIQQALLSRRPPPLAPAVTVQPDANGNPEFAGDGVVLAYPQPAERFEFIPGPGQRLLNYAIMPATGFDSMGFVELVVENGRVTSLMDIEISGAGRRAGVGRKVIETILAANPDADVNISNIVHQARGFWAKMGVPEQNLEDGAAYDGTLNWQAYAQAANDGRAAQVGQGMRGETGADDGRRQGAGRGAEGGAQAPVLSQRDPTQTPAFERWFGDSKVVDAQGKPLVVYHGTNQDFDSFSEERQSSKTGNPNAQLGYFFTDSPGEASRYAKAWGTTGGNVMPVYLAVNTPYAMPYKEFNDLAMGAWARLMAEPGYDPQAITPNDEASQRAAAARYAGHEVGAKQDAIKRRNELIAEGYDGIVVKVGGVREFIAFSPEQIKSAIGNSGAFDPSSPSILLSQKPKTEAGWAMPDGGKFDNFVHRFQDKNVDLKRSIGAIKQRVGEIADAIDAYLQEELFHGRSAKRTQDFVQTELEPLLADMKAKGIGTAQLDLYLHARHAEEANKLIAERNKDPNEGQKDIDGKVITSPLQDGGSGMLTKTARDYLAGKQVEIDGQTVTGPSGDGLKALQEVAAKVDAIINKTRVYNLAYGLISPAEAQSWATMFKHYVPLFREDKDGGMGIGQGYSIKGPEAKHRTGSTAKVVDILANIALAREKAIVRGEKNRVAVALVGLAKANPNDDIWEFGPITERRFNEQTGLVEVKMKNGWKSADNVLVAKIRTTKGAIKEVGVVFNERNERAMRMAAALKNLDAAQLEGAMAVSAVITRWFAAINTQYNPVFGFVNLVRDIGGASINLSSTPLKDKRAAVLKNIPAALWAVGRVEAGGTPGNKAMAALWEEMQNEGGMTGFRDLYRNSQDRAKDIEFALNPAAWMDGTMGKIFTAGGLLRGPASMAQFGATKLFRGLSHYNTAMEAATRLSVYKVALEQGLSKQRAASLAKNITVNFNRKGQAGLQAGALYAFFNAAVQGTARIGEVVFDTKNGQGLRITPAGLKIITGGVALGGLQALALAMAGFDDDEPPQFVREKNLIIPTGWLTGKRDYVTIPMPLGWNVLPNIGRITTEWAMSGFADPRKRAFKMVGTVLDSFNPLGNATLAQTMSPTPFDPFVALLENKDWTGKPIARQMFDKAAAGWKSSKDTATDHAKFIAKMVNYALGGTEHQGNQIWNATPDQIDYLIGQAFGGVARELGKAEQTVGALRTGEDLPAHKVPLLGRFYGNAEQSSAQASRFYENMERFDYHQAEVKGLAEAWRRANGLAVSADATDDPQYKAYLAKHPEVALISASNRAERAVQKLRKEKSQMLKDGKPRADVKEKEAEITAAMRAFNEAAKSAMRPKKAPALQE